ncbi:hypothetical protein ACN28S_27430 [Cystobacter fuscus]
MGTQEELGQLLSLEGFDVTQATLSRIWRSWAPCACPCPRVARCTAWRRRPRVGASPA